MFGSTCAETNYGVYNKSGMGDLKKKELRTRITQQSIHETSKTLVEATKWQIKGVKKQSIQFDANIPLKIDRWAKIDN